MKTTDLVVARFERYFRHPAPLHEVLVQGDRAVACQNVWQALFYLGHGPQANLQPDDDVFSPDLSATVAAYQKAIGHVVQDGKVGPNTRRRLVNDLMTRHGPLVFGRLRKLTEDGQSSVFLSYASEDSAKVDKLDQWLRDKGVHVLRDKELFIAGHTVADNIHWAVARADKILAIHSVHAKNKDWPRLELSLGEELERAIRERVLIYIRLDDTPLPAHDTARLAIDAQARPLREVGEDVLHAIYSDYARARPRVVFDDRDPL